MSPVGTFAGTGLYGLDAGEIEALPCVRPNAPTVPYEVKLRVDYRRVSDNDPVLTAHYWTAARTKHQTVYTPIIPIACNHAACHEYVLEQARRLEVPAEIPASVLDRINDAHPLRHNRSDMYSPPFDLATLRALLDPDIQPTQEGSHA